MASTEEGQVIACHSIDEWKERFHNAMDAKKPLHGVDLVGCRVIAPFVAEVAHSKPTLIFLKVDVDELMTVAEEFQVRSVPTFLLLHKGEVLGMVVGARKQELLALVAQFT